MMLRGTNGTSYWNTNPFLPVSLLRTFVLRWRWNSPTSPACLSSAPRWTARWSTSSSAATSSCPRGPRTRTSLWMRRCSTSWPAGGSELPRTARGAFVGQAPGGEGLGHRARGLLFYSPSCLIVVPKSPEQRCNHNSSQPFHCWRWPGPFFFFFFITLMFWWMQQIFTRTWTGEVPLFSFVHLPSSPPGLDDHQLTSTTPSF